MPNGIAKEQRYKWEQRGRHERVQVKQNCKWNEKKETNWKRCGNKLNFCHLPSTIFSYYFFFFLLYK